MRRTRCRRGSFPRRTAYCSSRPLRWQTSGVLGQRREPHSACSKKHAVSDLWQYGVAVVIKAIAGPTRPAVAAVAAHAPPVRRARLGRGFGLMTSTWTNVVGITVADKSLISSWSGSTGAQLVVKVILLHRVKEEDEQVWTTHPVWIRIHAQQASRGKLWQRSW